MIAARSVLMASASVLALAACSSQACTTAGCGSFVGVDLGEVLDKARGPVTARLCVQDDCETREIRGDASDAGVIDVSVPSREHGDQTVAVRLTLRVSRGDRVFTDLATDTTLSGYAPNGFTCSPVCYGANLILRDGRLVPLT